MKNLLLTALAPIIWGTGYWVTTEMLTDVGPLFVAGLRALPVGLMLIFYFGQLPTGVWWWRILLLGSLNIGVFMGLLLYATYRVPGGIVATTGAIQPLLVILLSWPLFRQKPTPITLLASVGGILGVGLLVLSPSTVLDEKGLIAAIGAAVVMAAGVALSKYWERPVSIFLYTGWQLTVGGLLLMVVALFVEGLPQDFTITNAWGTLWLSVFGSGLTYLLWFRGLEKMQAWQVSFLGLLTPIVAMLVGFFALDQTLNLTQWAGIFLILLSIVAAQGWFEKLFAKRPQASFFNLLRKAI